MTLFYGAQDTGHLQAVVLHDCLIRKRRHHELWPFQRTAGDDSRIVGVVSTWLFAFLIKRDGRDTARMRNARTVRSRYFTERGIDEI
ncbi:MAG TPA: hypothetical protein VJS30_06175 [Paraburkholderia sp.]|nr:hypothetical protein [Paraburkholderia sp.]